MLPKVDRNAVADSSTCRSATEAITRPLVAREFGREDCGHDSAAETAPEV